MWGMKKASGVRPLIIQGYNGPAEDAVVSPDGKFLFFDSFYSTASTCSMYCANLSAEGDVAFAGPVTGVNVSGGITLRGNYDLQSNFYFISSQFQSTGFFIGVGRGVFNNGTVTGAITLPGIVPPTPPPIGMMAVVLDIAISVDGNTMFLSTAIANPEGGIPMSQIVLATKNSDGSFSYLPESFWMLANVNALGIVYNSAPTPNGLGLSFTCNDPVLGPRIWVTSRRSTTEPFGTPQLFSEVNGIGPVGSYSESGSFAPNGDFYFHIVPSLTSADLWMIPHGGF
jgi:hypothetical protein